MGDLGAGGACWVGAEGVGGGGGVPAFVSGGGARAVGGGEEAGGFERVVAGDYEVCCACYSGGCLEGWVFGGREARLNGASGVVFVEDWVEGLAPPFDEVSV